MKTLRKCINEINGLRFMFDNLQLNSSLGRRVLLEQEFMVDEKRIKTEIDNLEGVKEFFSKDENRNCEGLVSHKLSELNDIRTTINNLSDNRNLDDIELFEIKKFSLISQAILLNLNEYNFDTIVLKDLSEVIAILDPENTGIPSFYIYSAYSEQLNRFRKEQKQVVDKNSNEAEQLRIECVKIEDEIREELASKLFKFVSDLKENLNQLAYLDVLMSKAKQASKLSLSKPEISCDSTKYIGLFNPEIKSVLERQSKEFQAVDISFEEKPCLITGANMSGKTVLLKSIALSQYLFQFGFFVPAKQALIVPVDEIMMSVGDTQSELNGLSSFAVEMLNINQIISKARDGKNVLALVDELARTTNPDEGKKIVNAFVEIMNELNVRSIITTHYSGVAKNCRRLRVAGLKLDGNKEKITLENINEFMDYSLVETKSDEAPMEAIRIAEILEIDEEFVGKMNG